MTAIITTSNMIPKNEMRNTSQVQKESISEHTSTKAISNYYSFVETKLTYLQIM